MKTISIELFLKYRRLHGTNFSQHLTKLLVAAPPDADIGKIAEDAEIATFPSSFPTRQEAYELGKQRCHSP